MCILHSSLCYFRRRLASEEDIVTLGFTLSRCVCVRNIILGGEGNALYPVLSSCNFNTVHVYRYSVTFGYKVSRFKRIYE